MFSSSAKLTNKYVQFIFVSAEGGFIQIFNKYSDYSYTFKMIHILVLASNTIALDI